MDKHQLVSEAINELSKKISTNLSILDLGCGSGTYWKEIQFPGEITIIVGVDSRNEDDISIEEGGESFTRSIASMKDNQGLLGEYQFINSDVKEFVINNAAVYDLIVCFQLLSLLSKADAMMLLGHCKRILKTEGLFAICVPNKEFEIKEKLPPEISDDIRNKFNLDDKEFFEFVDGYDIVVHRQNMQYHWALLRCT